MACCGMRPGEILNTIFKSTPVTPRPPSIEGATITTTEKDGTVIKKEEA